MDNNFEQQYGWQPNEQPTSHKPKKKKSIVFKMGILIVLAMLVGAGSFTIYHVITKEQGEPKKEEVVSTSNIKIEQTKVLEPSSTAGVDQVVEQVMPSIVSINVSVPTTNYFGQSYEATGSGSGIIYKKTDKLLYVITNYHVIEDASTIGVSFIDDEIVSATVKGYDSSADLAVLEVSLDKMKDTTKKSIKLMELGSSENALVGQMAVAIGNALGYGQSVTVGYLSAKDRVVSVDGNNMLLLQTDAAINPGNSGGALLNLQGELIGINSIKFSSDEVEGMGYAIPISKAVPIIEDLITREPLKENEKGYLGIVGISVDEVANVYYNIPYGVLVKEVAPGGAAEVAGIKANDIITKINEIEVTAIQSLVERVNGYRKGTTITLTVMRNTDGTYQEMKLKVKLQGKETLDGLTIEEQQIPNTPQIPNTEDLPIE